MISALYNIAYPIEHKQNVQSVLKEIISWGDQAMATLHAALMANKRTSLFEPNKDDYYAHQSSNMYFPSSMANPLRSIRETHTERRQQAFARSMGIALADGMGKQLEKIHSKLEIMDRQNPQQRRRVTDFRQNQRRIQNRSNQNDVQQEQQN